MTTFKGLLATAILAVPVMIASMPAEALTARQYAAQGRGHYISSTGGHLGWAGHRHWHRHWHHRRYR